MAKKITNIDISTPVVSREKYLEQQRQQIIDAAIQNSYDREFPEIPYTLKFENENKWREYMEGKINETNNLIENAPYEGIAEIYRERLNGLEAELAKGYTPELCEGPTCIYTTTGNFGEQYQVAGNRSFRGNPEKYGFVEIGLNEIKPGDVIQDFSEGDGIPTHALMFVGFDSNGKALYNYSDGRHNESAIQKDAYYPFINSSVHLTSQNSDRLKNAIAAYRFIGNKKDNINWNSDYNIYRQNYTKQLSEQMKDVPVLNLPKVVESNLKHFIKAPTYKYEGTIKTKSNKKMLGAAIIGAASSLIGTGIQASSQRKLYEQQQADQRKLQNIQNTNAMINNLNQQANNNMDWAYDKFKPSFKLGGTQSKFKNRF